ncbi:hypothetical protein GCM10023116_47990 [Kistimonas scapharcae]|uniref:Uncharacterized protein n=1 Tax=Kistimonas scapharcae TaxID=1036133 RepID=A0ABP8V936_9GAMM
MIVFADSISQQAVAEAMRRYDYVRDRITSWLMEASYQQRCLTPENERDDTPLEQWQWENNVEARHMMKTVICVNSNDIDKPTGLPLEIGFARYTVHVGKYGIPSGEPDQQGWGYFNGVLLNHGTIGDPDWSIHT